MIILIQTLLVSLISRIIIQTYWFSYILFLTFLGGLLVLFIYVSRIASNEIFNIKITTKILFIIIIIISLFIRFFNYNLKWINLNINNYDIYKLFDIFLFFNNENKINLSKLYNNQTFITLIIIIIYLFITLIAVIKITNIFYGPLRSFTY